MGDFEDETGIYSGQLKNGVPYGYGMKMYWNNIIYEGYWVNGAKHGRGKFIFDEIVIEGEFIEGNFVECYASGLHYDKLLDMINRVVRVEFNGKCYEEKLGEPFDSKLDLMKSDEKCIRIPKNLTCNEITRIKIDGSREIEGIFANGEAIGLCKVYENNYLVYEGEVKNGYYEGEGTGFNNLGIEYVGQFKKGKYDGKGIKYSGDIIISGDFKNGYENGCIKMESTDKILEGLFVNGQANGFAKLVTPRYTYEGEFLNFKFHGKGKKNFGYYEIEGTFYQGNILNPCNVTVLQEVLYSGHFDENLGFHGHGIILNINDNYTLEGDFERMRLIEKRVKMNFGLFSIEGKKPSNLWFSGTCRFTSPNNSWIISLSPYRYKFPYLTQANFLEYERSFKEKPASLFRKIKFSEGVYSGEVYEKAFHGKGQILFYNGEMYIGTFFMNKMHGQGSYFYADKSVYAGGFVDNKKQGKGILTLKDTSVYSGYWNEDLLDGLCIVKLNNQHVETYWNKGELCAGFKLICNGFSAYGKIVM